MEKERENFYRTITLILHLGTKSERELLKLHLQSENITLQYLLGMNEHDLYHLYYNTKKCCKCTTNYMLPKKRILNLTQLGVLFDMSPTRPTGGSASFCNTYGFCCCQLLSKASLTVEQLDFTLSRCLLINCCEKVFTNHMLSGNTLEATLNKHKHELYHLWQPKTTCCLCPAGCSLIGQYQVISNRQWSTMYGVTNIQNSCKTCGCRGDACSANAVSGISLNMLDKKLITTILNTCCSLRKHLEDLTEFRNTMYGHALEPILTEQEFNEKWPKLKSCIVSLVEVCGNETTDRYRERIDKMLTEPLDGTLYRQYHTEILKEIKDNNDLKEEIVKHLQQATDQMASKQHTMDITLSDLNSKLDQLLDIPEKHTVSMSTQSIQTEVPVEEHDSIVLEFNKVLMEKENELVQLNTHISDANDYKVVYNEKTEELRQIIQQRSQAMKEAIMAKEEELLQEVDKSRCEALQNMNEFIQSCSNVNQKGEKKIANYKKMLTNMQDDQEMMKQFAEDSLSVLTAMDVSVKRQFPCPLTFEYNPGNKIEDLFGNLKGDQWFGADGKEKPKYRKDLDVQNKFKVEYTQPRKSDASIYQIIIRPGHKAWVSTSNYNFFLINQTGTILMKKTFKFLISRSACDKDGNLFCCDQFNKKKIRKICLKDLEQNTHDFPVHEFENMYPFMVHDLYINNDDELLVLVGEGYEDTKKIVIFSKSGMLIREVELDTIHTKNITQNLSGQICISAKMNMVIIEPCGTKMTHYNKDEETWAAIGLIADPFDNFMSSECPFESRPLNIHITNAKGKIIKIFTIQGPSIYGIVCLALDYNDDEPLLWMSSSNGHVIVAKFVNTE